MSIVEILGAFFAQLSTIVVVGTLVLYHAALGILGGGAVVSTPPIQIVPRVHTGAPSSSVSVSSSTSTSTAAQNSAPATKPKVVKLISTAAFVPPATSSTTSPPVPPIDSTLLNSEARAAVVNILCTTQSSVVHPISASGVFIDTRGVILTNAHVGQFFLLRDYPFQGNVNCVVRTGSPAAPMYKASLLFLPPQWINSNASQLVAEHAMGTGESDYAFLVVTGPVGQSVSMPAQFPALSMTSAEPDIGSQTLLAAYPAGFLDGMTIERYLYITSAYASVTDLFTFGQGRDVDLVSIGGTIVSQGGSSGGAMVRAQDGKLEGIIATATSADTTAQRDLRAITLAYINRNLSLLGKGGIAEFLSQDLSAVAANFATSVAPGETTKLIQAIEHR